MKSLSRAVMLSCQSLAFAALPVVAWAEDSSLHITRYAASAAVQRQCNGQLTMSNGSDGSTTWNCRPIAAQAWGCTWAPNPGATDGRLNCFTDFR
jgi:hypothetical protein